MYNILICDDEKDIVAALKIYLSSEEYRLYEAYSGDEALAILREHDIQLILMDIMMPGTDGITATVKIREESNVPVILLTAKSEDTDKILGLNIGADDYITKPFNPMEVLARVKSQLRRYTNLGSWDRRSNVYETGGLMLDDDSKKVTVDGEPVSLTPIEYSILKLLMKTPGKVYSSREIYQLIWDGDPWKSESTVAVHVRHIREKIEINPSEPRYLTVVWGQGYKIEKSGKKPKGDL